MACPLPLPGLVIPQEGLPEGHPDLRMLNCPLGLGTAHLGRVIPVGCLRQLSALHLPSLPASPLPALAPLLCLWAPGDTGSWLCLTTQGSGLGSSPRSPASVAADSRGEHTLCLWDHLELVGAWQGEEAGPRGSRGSGKPLSSPCQPTRMPPPTCPLDLCGSCFVLWLAPPSWGP